MSASGETFLAPIRRALLPVFSLIAHVQRLSLCPGCPDVCPRLSAAWASSVSRQSTGRMSTLCFLAVVCVSRPPRLFSLSSLFSPRLPSTAAPCSSPALPAFSRRPQEARQPTARQLLPCGSTSNGALRTHVSHPPRLFFLSSPLPSQRCFSPGPARPCPRQRPPRHCALHAERRGWTCIPFWSLLFPTSCPATAPRVPRLPFGSLARLASCGRIPRQTSPEVAHGTRCARHARGTDGGCASLGFFTRFKECRASGKIPAKIQRRSSAAPPLPCYRTAQPVNYM